MGHRFTPGEYIGENDRYRILRTLGEGGMGRVYLAHDERLKREVAIKVLLSSKDFEGTKRKRFQREVQIAGNLSHPNLVPVFDFLFTEEFDMFVQEYVRGEDLDCLLETSNLNEHEGRQLLADLAAPLEYLHERGMVHRDIKPANILKDEQGPFRLMDFGLAYDPELTRMTVEGTLLGTLLYLPPEIALGEAATPASDIYQVGLVLHQAMTGISLHEIPEDDGDINAMLFAGLKRRETEPSLPEDIIEIIDGCCHRDPEKRIRDGRELVEKIESSAANAREQGKKRSFQSTVSITPFKKKNKHFLCALCVLSFLFLIFFAYLSFRSNNNADSDNLFALASSRLLLPQKLILTFPRGSLLRPTWYFEGESGQFERRTRGLCLILKRPSHKNRGTLTIKTASGRQTTEEIVFPNSPFNKGPQLRCGYENFQLSWTLHHEYPVNFELRMKKSNELIYRKKGVTRLCSFTTTALRGDREVSWFLRAGNEIIGSGDAIMGLSCKYEIPEPTGSREGKYQPIIGVAQSKKTLLLATKDSRVDALTLCPSAKGSYLNVLWSKNVPPVHFSDVKLFTITSNEDFYLCHGGNQRTTLIHGTRADHREHVFDLALHNVFVVKLGNNRLLCLYQATTNQNEVNVAVLDQGVVKAGCSVRGSRAYGLITRGDNIIAFIGREEKLEAHYLVVGAKDVKSVRSVTVGPQPLEFHDLHEFQPNALVSTEIPKSHDIFLAYQDKGLIFSSETGSVRAINLQLPEETHAKCVFKDDKDAIFLLALGKSIGLTRSAINQSRLYMVELQCTESGLISKGRHVVIPLVLTSVIRGRSFGGIIGSNRLFICSKSHFVVIDRQTKRAIYTYFRYGQIFNFGMFFVDHTLLLPTRDGIIHGMDIFDEVLQ